MRKHGKKKPEDPIAARLELQAALRTGSLTLGESVRRMRALTGKTQEEFARLLGIAPRIIIDLERGVGNPTLKTLEKIGAPFGMRVRYLPAK